MLSTPAVWKQYNKMAVLHFFLVNSTLIYILFSLAAVLFTIRTVRLSCAVVLFTVHTARLSSSAVLFTICTARLPSAAVQFTIKIWSKSRHCIPQY